MAKKQDIKTQDAREEEEVKGELEPISEEEIFERTRLGLTREQAIQGIQMQRENDLKADAES